MREVTNSKLPVFSSFMMAGYECTYALAENKRRLDLLAATKHDEYCEEDYRLIKDVGMRTVREGLSWNQIDKGNSVYDFSRFEKIMQMGKKENIQQIWDLNHFDYPEYLDPFSEDFVTQFGKYAAEAIKVIQRYQKNPLYIVPLNEISFFAWIGADMGWWAPYKKGRQNGFRLKSQLVKANIAAMEAIWQLNPEVRFIQVDPFMRRLATEPATRTAKKHVQEFNDIVRFEAWDMLCGKAHPEIGGDPKYLDIIGVNYYVHNQEWVISEKENGKNKIRHQMMDWDSSDRVPFWKMLEDIYQRYGRPMIVSETGSYGELRYRWWERVLKEIDEGLKEGLPICGVCSYPTVDRPESAGFLLPNSGIWDFEAEDLACRRVPHPHTIEVIRQFAQQH